MRFLSRIAKFLSGDKGKRSNSSFPYEYYEPNYGLRFAINNVVEQFRLRDWGGEKEYVVEMINELRPSDIFYDIGASVGLNSILSAKHLTEGKVISFEPDPENLRCLKKNYALNGLSNFQIQEMAVGSEAGQMDLFTNGSNGYSPSLRGVNGIERFIKVKVNSIDNLLAEKLIPLPTVIKIDIEGAEMLALAGMNKLLTSSDRPRVIFIEIHPEFLTSFETSADEVLDYLSKLNYEVITENPRNQQILCKLIRKN